MHTQHYAHNQQISTATIMIILFATFAVFTLVAVLLRTVHTQLNSSNTFSTQETSAPFHATERTQTPALSSL